MNTKEKLTLALKTALKNRDDTTKRVLRLALAGIKNAEVEKREELDEPAVLSILQKEVKARNETIEGARPSNRQDLIDTAEEELAILKTFLPQPLTEEEIKGMVEKAISDTGASTIREMGLVMKQLMPLTQGRADGKLVSEIVRSNLLN